MDLAPSPPALRVAVFGELRALVELEAWARPPSSHRWVPDDFGAAWTVTTDARQVTFVVPAPHTPRLALARLDADVVLVAAAKQRPFWACGPPRLFGRSVFRRATPVVWLGAGAGAVEERTLRGALRAHGLRSDGPVVIADEAPLAGLAAVLDAITPGHPETLALDPVEGDGAWFCCAACGARLTRGMDQVRTHDGPRPSDEFEYNLRLLPGGGVFTFAPDAEAWASRQAGPGPGPREVALLDHVDLVDAQVTRVRPWGGGCCGMVPVGEPNLACRCGARVGYSWTECVFYSVVALRLDRVTHHSRGRVVTARPRAASRG
jgi:hypothetical protein